MEAFEKWFEDITESCKIDNNICDKVGNCNACESLQKIGWKASRKELLKEIDKRFVNIIKLCDHPIYSKENIRQVANDACSFIYLLQKELENE